ncbi:hypothetical protein QUA81_18680 [Microcoleus sp. F6_B4]
MQSAIRITTKVLAGNKLEIQVPPGSVGEDVEVFGLYHKSLKVGGVKCWNCLQKSAAVMFPELLKKLTGN